MSDDVLFDPFTTNHLMNHGDRDLHDSHAWHGFQTDLRLDSGLLKLAQSQHIQLDPLRAGAFVLNTDDTPLPDLDSLRHESPASVKNGLSQSSWTNNESDVKAQAQVQEEDVWACIEVQKPREENRLLTWDTFLDHHHETPPVAYLSEAGSLVFDAFLRKFLVDDHQDKILRYAKPHFFIGALLDLALGRVSLFFEWNPKTKQFAIGDDRCTVSGISEQVTQGIMAKFLFCGSQYRRLEEFTDAGHRLHAVEIAFARAIGDVLATVKDTVESRRKETVTMLQLQELFQRPFQVIDVLASMLTLFTTHRESNRSMRELVAFVSHSTAADFALEQTLVQILARTVQPLLQALDRRIGLQNPQTASEGHLLMGCDQVLSASNVSQMESTEALFEILQQVTPQKVMPIVAAVQDCACSFGTSWEQVEEVHAKISLYELRCRDVLENSRNSSHSWLSRTDSNQNSSGLVEQEGSPFSFRPEYFIAKAADRSPLASSVQTPLKEAVRAMLCTREYPTFAMSIAVDQALELSIAPLVAAQHRILSYSILQTLFDDFNVIGHLQSLWRFHLMGDGPFTSRLSTALFDSAQTNGNSQRSTGSAIGLRLQSRETWPPASSELRLVLMDILSESMSDLKDQAVMVATSFAIRELPDDELERCRHVDSIHALDFLRLHYKASNSILESVMTTKSLKRYDTIFMYLLRLLRVKDLTQHLLREACVRHGHGKEGAVEGELDPVERKLRWSLHQFTSALANYAQNVAIHTHWHNFETTLLAIQSRLSERDYEGTLLLAGSPEHMRNLHEQSLEKITQALFLKKSQTEGRRAIEDMFTIILRYASSGLDSSREQPGLGTNLNEKTRSTKSGPPPLPGARVRPSTPPKLFYDEFQTKLKTLLQYLRNTSSREASTAKSSHETRFKTVGIDSDDDNDDNDDSTDGDREGSQMAAMAEQLLLALDFQGFY